MRHPLSWPIALGALLLAIGLASPARAPTAVEYDVVVVECEYKDVHLFFSSLNASKDTFDVPPVWTPKETHCADVLKFLLEEGFNSEVVPAEIAEKNGIVTPSMLPAVIRENKFLNWTLIREADGNGIGEPAG